MILSTRKRNALMSAYTGFAGTQTLGLVLEQIPQDLADSLTGKQLGALASLLYVTYNKGRASTGASIEDDCVWIQPLEKLIPLEDLKGLGASR